MSNLLDEILKLKKNTKAQMEDALKANKIEKIYPLAKDLDLFDRLEKQYHEIASAIHIINHRGKPDSGDIPYYKKSPKKIGNEERLSFLLEANKKGISLTQEKGPLCRNKSGGFVGVAYASESVANRWLLGLPIKKYESIVLICKKELLQSLYLIFPYSFFETHQTKFSTDENGSQFKFNISLKNGRYTLIIPDSDPIIIDEYINKFENITN